MLVAGYLTLPSSHTTAFLRCLQHGCPPPDNGPPLDVPKSDPCWDLITQGWSWLVISHEVEAALPSLPAFLAMANNSTNSISAASNELECAMMLAHYHKCGIPMKDAIDRVKAGGIQCQSSLPHVASYVQRYAGGCHFPLLEFLSTFGTWAILIHFCLFIPLFVQITKMYPSNFLPKQLCNQADSSMPAS